MFIICVTPSCKKTTWLKTGGKTRPFLETYPLHVFGEPTGVNSTNPTTDLNCGDDKGDATPTRLDGASWDGI